MSEEFEAGARSVERGYERTIERLERELAAAQAEIAALREDAERYRWWVNNYGSEYDGPGTMKLYTIVRYGPTRTKEQFDAAIDAARAKSRPV
jgi:hypothetical protein